MSVSFSDGTVVQLKSGSPLMTVNHFDDGREQYLCEWFNKENVERAYFNGASLKEYRDEQY
ncbi:TPA: YodC family protein [Escherichia albertii]